MRALAEPHYRQIVSALKDIIDDCIVGTFQSVEDTARSEQIIDAANIVIEYLGGAPVDIPARVVAIALMSDNCAVPSDDRENTAK